MWRERGLPRPLPARLRGAPQARASSPRPPVRRLADGVKPAWVQVRGRARVGGRGGARRAGEGGRGVGWRVKGEEREPSRCTATLPAVFPTPVTFAVDAKGLARTLAELKRSPALA